MSLPPRTLTLGRLHTRHRPPGTTGRPPLLLVHGLTEDSACWPDAEDRWAAHPVYSVDLTGHGRSPRLRPDELDDPMSVAADDVGDALRAVTQLEGRPPIGIGHSMGGGALTVAVHRGAPVTALVLEDPRVAHVTTPARVRLGRMRAREQRIWRDDPATARAELDRACPRWSVRERAASAAARPLTDTALLATGRSGLHGDDDLQVRLVAEVAATTPTTLVTGSVGVVWTRPLVERLRAASADVDVVVLPDADHAARRTDPNGYHRVVDALLADPRRRPG